MKDENKIALCAENIANCMNIKKGECVYIRGNACFQDVVEKVALNILRYGGHPLINLRTDEYWKNVYFDEKITTETLQETPKHLLKLTEHIDARITFPYYEDPFMRAKVSKEKINAMRKCFEPMDEMVLEKKRMYFSGKKWLNVVCPTKQAAKYYNINFKLFKKIYDRWNISFF